jgi:hypothetical protein
MPGVWAQNEGGEWGAGTRQEFRTCQLLRDFLARTCPTCPVTKPGESYQFMRWHFRVETDFFFAFARIFFFFSSIAEDSSLIYGDFLNQAKKIDVVPNVYLNFLIRSRQKVTLSCVYASVVETESFLLCFCDIFFFFKAGDSSLILYLLLQVWFG